MQEERPRVRMPLPAAVQGSYIGNVPVVSGFPSYTPTPDQLPLAHDAVAGVLYYYTNEWKALGLTALEELDLSNITNLDNVLRIPVTYVTGGKQVEGYVTLKEFKKL